MDFIAPKPLALSVALIGVAMPAVAQEACGGLGANGQWIGGNESASDITTSDNYREQMALVLSGNQYVSLFSVSAPTAVRIEAAGRGAGDPLIDVIDPDGNIILSDDDSGGNSAARAEVELDPGTYCMSLSSFDGAPMTAFVRIGRPEQEPLTEGVSVTSNTGSEDIMPVNEDGSCRDATALGALSGALTATASVDTTPYWSFTLETPTAVSITASNEDADPVVTLYDADENYITENDDYDGLNSRIDQSEPLAAGDYCVQVAALNDTSLPIDLEITEYDPDAALAALYDRGEVAPPLDGSVAIENLGTLENRLRKDAQISTSATWYSIDLSQGGLLLVEAIAAGSDGDPWVAVFDDLGRQVAMNDDYGDGLDSLVTARVNSGTYLVAVKQVGGSSQGLIRMVFERYIPAP
ncbi:hypothetical protein SAMN04488515_2731 [Cognatiyoonia koreensis]|uniref:Pre-peptidase C-terminal domain-containing protein n=1 Tax=Cognatiyoonia koreensis TaxID=364200 RepID=A0A1I0RIA4_9RHOB|nr:DVUA0089 family protein [Cognatiyoonia koreensis]SEW40671.1 hypothetical protein SAMN04488515_2731 [Cognatiyoonia koreensis]